MEYATARLARDEERAPARRAAFDAPFAALTLLLLTVGVVMVLSASYARAYFSASTGHNAAYYFIRQLGFAAAGTAAMFILSRFPMGFYARMSFPALAASVVLLALVPVIGVSQGMPSAG